MVKREPELAQGGDVIDAPALDLDLAFQLGLEPLGLEVDHHVLGDRVVLTELLDHADELLVDELLDPEGPELAAEAGVLDAAEWQLGAV
jgi:hypothetical protein